MATIQVGLQKAVGMKTLEPQKHHVRALLGGNKASQLRGDVYLKPDFRTGENFTHLKLTAEKMMQEQACVKTDLQIVSGKLQKSEEQVRVLETKLQDVTNENAMLKVKQQEDLKLWKAVDSKFSVTKTFCDQLTETLQHLAIQVQEAEKSKISLEEKLVESVKLYEDLKERTDQLSSAKTRSEEIAEKWERDCTELKEQRDELQRSLTLEVDRIEKIALEKAEVENQLRIANKSVEDERTALESLQQNLDVVQTELARKEEDFRILQEQSIDMAKSMAQGELREEELQRQLSSVAENNELLKEKTENLVSKVQQLEKTNDIAASDMEKLLLEKARCDEWAQGEQCAKEKALDDLQKLNLQYDELESIKHSLQNQIEELQKEVLVLNERHAVIAKENAEKEQASKAELELALQSIQQVCSDKLKLEETAQGLEERNSLLLKNLSEVQKEKEDMINLMSQLKADTDSANESSKQIIGEKSLEIRILQKKIGEDSQELNLCKSENSQLRQTCMEKGHLIQQMVERQNSLKEQNEEILKKMAAAEHAAFEIQKQVEIQLEAKQVDLNKHIKEISERNDQEMADMRRKYEAETREAIFKEEQKASLLLESAKQEYGLQIAKVQENALAKQKAYQEEHEARVKELLQIHESEKQRILGEYKEELRIKEEGLRSELAKQNLQHMKERENMAKELQRQHQEEIKEFQTENKSKHFQSKEALEKQIMALKEQLKEDKLKREEDLKEKSKKFDETVQRYEAECKIQKENYQKSVSALKASFEKDLDEMKKNALFWEMKCKTLESKAVKESTDKGQRQGLQENSGSSTRHFTRCQQPSPAYQKTVAAEKACTLTEKKSDSIIGLPTHSKTITQHEYEVATSDGRKTITKRKRTRSTVMIGDQPTGSELNIKKLRGRKKTKISAQHKKKSKTSHAYASTIGELFGGRSLDPYADDPYAFD